MFPLKTIVLTTDFSDCARAAIPAAVDLARRYEAILHVAHVLTYPVPYPAFYYGMESNPYPVNPPWDLAKMTKDAFAEMERWLGKDAAGIKRENIILQGIPVPTLLNYLEETHCDLVVMSTHGYGFFKRMLLGSFANAIVQHSPCPVLTIRTLFGQEPQWKNL